MRAFGFIDGKGAGQPLQGGGAFGECLGCRFGGSIETPLLRVFSPLSLILAEAIEKAKQGKQSSWFQATLMEHPGKSTNIVPVPINESSVLVRRGATRAAFKHTCTRKPPCLIFHLARHELTASPGFPREPK